jgi:queuine tRNA-ribosyltransferase
VEQNKQRAHFRLDERSGHARAGTFFTGGHAVTTPAFMPVGTQATVKALAPEDITNTGAQMAIMNTYHLWLRPGPDIVAAAGGLRRFSGYGGVIATDSGGFQAFSLGERTQVSEAGFTFSSHLDGQKLLLSPERAMEVQGQLGADVVMQLDICAPGASPRADLIAACERTTRWAERCLKARRVEPLPSGAMQAVFAIVQGGTEVDLRQAHLEQLSAMDFDGLALGGFSVGEPPEKMHETLAQVAPMMDPLRIHYLMGVGTPSDLVRAIGQGIDLFDCVMPTRNARNGQAFVNGGKLVIKNAKFKNDFRVLDEGCDCATCVSGVSRAFLRHLYVAEEMLFHRYMSIHNLRYYARLMEDARKAILEQRYATFSEQKLREFGTAGQMDST